MEELRKELENIIIITRSLSRRSPMKWTAKEVKEERKLLYDVEVYLLAEDNQLLHFLSKVDYNAMIKGGPWFVTSQLLAMELFR